MALDYAWIQALLILDGNLPSSDFVQEQRQYQGVKRVDVSITARGESNTRESDLAQKQPFWTSTIRETTLPCVLGNEVVVNAFPYSLNFMLYCVICIMQDIDYSWNIIGPHQSSNEEIIFQSKIKRVTFHQLGSLSSVRAPVSVRTIKDGSFPRFSEAGWYSLVALLDGCEAGRIPLLVRQPMG